MKTKLITPLALNIWRITPGARLRGARDHFWPLFWCAVAVLGGLICFLLHLEAMYRKDAGRALEASLLREDARKSVLEGSPWSASPGAVVTGSRDGQPTLHW